MWSFLHKNFHAVVRNSISGVPVFQLKTAPFCPPEQVVVSDIPSQGVSLSMSEAVTMTHHSLVGHSMSSLVLPSRFGHLRGKSHSVE